MDLSVTDTKQAEQFITLLKHINIISTNITLYFNEDSITEIVNRINSDIETMEGASVFKVCEELDVSYMQIRAISNNVEIRNKDNWDINLAIRNLNSEVEKIIDTL